ncbi:MAG TPA: OadG family protein [Myxococcota bacterium]|nr:OadG family protein [Myxococcota bacterium]HRY96389.1 OadG family protein [Myxococcota bacterium]HSA20845.1 OadG family protein [Myxococcota bacterium]
MLDGLVILAIGMGVVFSFLILLIFVVHGLHRFERLLSGARPGPAVLPDSPPEEACGEAAAGPAATPAEDEDEGKRLAAALAVAFALETQGAARPPTEAAGESGGAWRRAGRLMLMQPPARVARRGGQP